MSPIQRLNGITTYAAPQTAHNLGFREVVIIGMVHRHEYTGWPDELCKLEGTDPSPFSFDYFGIGKDWQNPDLAHPEESYRTARTKFEEDGCMILDTTLESACDIFEKIDYMKLLQK